MEALKTAANGVATRSPMWWRAPSKGINHKQRCRALPPLTEAELARMIADFHNRGGTVTQVATAYVLPTSTAMHVIQVG